MFVKVDEMVYDIDSIEPEKKKKRYKSYRHGFRRKYKKLKSEGGGDVSCGGCKKKKK